MIPRSSPIEFRLRRSFALLLVVGFLAPACAPSPARSPLPPSASDLALMKGASLCDQEKAFLDRHAGIPVRREAWGSGDELRISANRGAAGAEESWFFDQDGLLVGALFAFPNGLELKSYPVLRETLSQLKPDVEFYVRARVPGRENLDTSALYKTGEEKSTHQYLTLGAGNSAVLLLASMTIDPYETLLSPFRQEYLARVGQGDQSRSGPHPGGQRVEAKEEPFASLQQFARGQAAHLGYCGTRNYGIAVDAYRQALAHGFSNKVWLAEVHHKLGLVLEATGQLEPARDEMLQSLAIRPNTPEILNNLGTVYLKLGSRPKAIEVLEKAVTLRPNYAIARYNLAEAYEPVNTKRALSEYDTYLALVEGIPEEEERAARAKARIAALKR